MSGKVICFSIILEKQLEMLLDSLIKEGLVAL